MIARSRARPRVGVAARCLLALALAMTAACGKKGPPLAPLRQSPARIDDLVVTRRGNDVIARFTVPAANTDGTKPADLDSVEVIALTGALDDQFGQPLPPADFVRFAEVVGRVPIKPPPDPEAEDEASPEAQPPAAEGAPAAQPGAAALQPPADPRPAQGEPAAVADTLDGDKLKPWEHPEARRTKTTDDSATKTFAVPLRWPPPGDLPSRAYAVHGVSTKGVKGPLSGRVLMPLIDLPVPPAEIRLEYTPSAIGVAWKEPETAARPIQRAPVERELPARALVQGATPTTYNVYAVTQTGGSAVLGAAPLNPAPLAAPAFTDGPPQFGSERCYAVTALRVFGNARLESAPSASVCVTPVDTFPPAPPTNLSAVGSEGGVSLIWDPGADADLAGYLVLRGEVPPAGAAAGGEATLTPITPEPIKETTYRDTTATPGVRYVYAVAAVDTAKNTSGPSNRVEEGAK